MKTVDISLNSIDKVKSFVNDINRFDCDFDLVSGRYVIDAKSIMGIFSLDLSKPIDLCIHADDAAAEAEFNKIVTYENKFVLWSEGFHYTGELEKDTVTVDGPIQHISSLKVCGFVEQNTLLTYKFNMGDTTCYFYDLQTNKISKTDYDIDKTFPVVINGDNILCMYESNYTDEIKWYNYQVSKDKLTRIKNENVILAAKHVEWIS